MWRPSGFGAEFRKGKKLCSKVPAAGRVSEGDAGEQAEEVSREGGRVQEGDREVEGRRRCGEVEGGEEEVWRG